MDNYTGPLTAEQQLYIRGLLCIFLEKQDPPEGYTQESWNLAWQDTIVFAWNNWACDINEQDVLSLHEELQSLVYAIHTYTSPTWLGHMDLGEQTPRWSTLSHSREYIFWLIKHNLDEKHLRLLQPIHPYPELLKNLKPGEICQGSDCDRFAQENKFQGIYLQMRHSYYLIAKELAQTSSFINKLPYARSLIFSIVSLCSKDELEFILMAFTGDKSPDKHNFKYLFYDDVTMWAKIKHRQHYYDVFISYLLVIIEESLKKLRQIDMINDPILFPVYILSLPQNELIHFCHAYRNHLTIPVLSAALSRIPPDQWHDFLNKTKMEERIITLMQRVQDGSFTQIFQYISSENWPELLNINGLESEIQRHAEESNFNHLQKIPIYLRYDLIHFGPIYKGVIISKQLSYNTAARLDYAHSMPSWRVSDALFSLLMSEAYKTVHDHAEIRWILGNLVGHILEYPKNPGLKELIHHIIVQGELFIHLELFTDQILKDFLHLPETRASFELAKDNPFGFVCYTSLHVRLHQLHDFFRDPIIYDKLATIFNSPFKIIRLIMYYPNLDINTLKQLPFFKDISEEIMEFCRKALEETFVNSFLGVENPTYDTICSFLLAAYSPDQDISLFTDGDDFHCSQQFHVFLNRLPLSQWDEFLALPGMSNHLLFNGSDEIALNRAEYFLNDKSKAYAYFSLPIIQAQEDLFLDSRFNFIIRMFNPNELKQYMNLKNRTEFLDHYFYPDHLRNFKRFIDFTIKGGEKLRAILLSDAMQTYLLKHIKTPDTIAYLLAKMNPKHRWSTLINNPAMKQLYEEFAKTNQLSPIFAVLDARFAKPDEFQEVIRTQYSYFNPTINTLNNSSDGENKIALKPKP